MCSAIEAGSMSETITLHRNQLNELVNYIYFISHTDHIQAVTRHPDDLNNLVTIKLGAIMKVESLTEEDLNSIEYFWTQKGDPTRWVYWDEKYEAIKQRFPELIETFETLQKLESRMDDITQSLHSHE